MVKVARWCLTHFEKRLAERIAESDASGAASSVDAPQVPAADAVANGEETYGKPGACGDAVPVLTAERCIERLKNGQENSEVSFEVSATTKRGNVRVTV